MTFTASLHTHRAALLRMVVMLLAASGLGAGRVMVLPIIRGSVLLTLRPLEAAARRLVVVKAYLLKQAGYVPKARAPRAKPSKPIPRGDGSRASVFPLFDPRRPVGANGRRKYAKTAPRMLFFDGSDPVFEAAPDSTVAAQDDPVDGARLLHRMEALKRALENLPKEARRLMRVQAAREKAGKRLVRAIRPGRPPGHRARGRFEADEVLRECHQLALMALAAPDTS